MGVIMPKLRVFSGIQPSGTLTLGNYLGAIKQFNNYTSDQFEALFCIVDLHAVNAENNVVTFRQNILNLAKFYVASGLDPQQVILFVQSHVPAHSELM